VIEYLGQEAQLVRMPDDYRLDEKATEKLRGS